MSSKRASTLPPVVKPPTSLSASLIISEQASLTGTNLITLGSNTVIHPRSKLNSLHAPIKIGNNCIISERSRIGLQSADSAVKIGGVVIEDGVVVETGAIVEASKIGNGCIIEVNSKIRKGAVLGKHCKVGPSCEVADGELVPDYTVIYGTGKRRIDASGAEQLQLDMVLKQIDVLRKLIPSSLAPFQKHESNFPVG